MIGCTENLLLGSLRTHQSSLTYVFKAALLAACSSCHGNHIAIFPPLFGPLDIPKAFFQSAGLLKPFGTRAECLRAQIHHVCALAVARMCVRFPGCVCESAGCVCASMHVCVLQTEQGQSDTRPSLDLRSRCRHGPSLCCSSSRSFTRGGQKPPGSSGIVQVFLSINNQ